MDCVLAPHCCEPLFPFCCRPRRGAAATAAAAAAGDRAPSEASSLHMPTGVEVAWLGLGRSGHSGVGGADEWVDGWIDGRTEGYS
ncbi:hypothetical protein AALO_G00177710 [Alosa alosa]|uniref:Secreted protein n=1 Tax=Alosa alosa TaxID=278164 RepID=A0AAV6G8H5_9TELE|nr:hypothetical protein AALO_G00177710 [Alosa alosa]